MLETKTKGDLQPVQDATLLKANLQPELLLKNVEPACFRESNSLLLPLLCLGET